MSVSKKITFRLSESSIDAAIRELDAYKRSVQQKAETLGVRVAQRIRDEAAQDFSTAIVSDLLGQDPQYAKVQVTIQPQPGNITLVIAAGPDAIFVEFGAGVFYNGPAGSSPHPRGEELGLTIGSYGKGHGKRDVWGFFTEDGLVLTHGAPAKMPMLKAAELVATQIYDIAQEVFRD